MPSSSQVNLFEEALTSKEAWEEEAEKLVSETVTLEDKEFHPKSFTAADNDVRAVLVNRKGAPGIVRVTSPTEFWNVTTGPKEEGWAIIGVKAGQTCTFVGENLNLRLFKASN